jgi:hypothetical protein
MGQKIKERTAKTPQENKKKGILVRQREEHDATW